MLVLRVARIVVELIAATLFWAWVLVYGFFSFLPRWWSNSTALAPRSIIKKRSPATKSADSSRVTHTTTGSVD